MQTENYISLSQLQTLIKERLQSEFNGQYWIVAEVSEISVRGGAGHCYMTLVDKTENSQMAKARISANIWSSKYVLIESFFRSQTGRNIEVGMKLLFKASVNYHELYGISLNVTDIDPTYTLGDIERQRQLVIASLKEDGLLELNKEIQMPNVLQRIAVVSSLTAAGYRDFERELQTNEWGFKYDITLFNSLMQGTGAQESIIKSLRQISCNHKSFDAVIIIRGGGAQSDLACFDQYELCCEIATMPLGVITGIGHDKDTSIADMTAHTSLKTPTAVAGYIIDLSKAYDTKLDTLKEYLNSYCSNYFETEKRNIDLSAQSLKTKTSEYVFHSEKTTEIKLINLKNLSVRLIEKLTDLAILKHEKVTTLTKHALSNRSLTLNQKEDRLKRGSIEYINTQKQLIEKSSLTIDGYNPERILKNGYAIARLGAKIIRTKNDVKIGDNVTINICDAVIDTKITNIKSITN